MPFDFQRARPLLQTCNLPALQSCDEPLNAGATFEAGFAMGLGTPTLWPRQQSEIVAGYVHFDTRLYSIVSWGPDKFEDFAMRLTKRIEATTGHGRYMAE